MAKQLADWAKDRKELIGKARLVVERAETSETRAISDEDKAQVDKIMAEVDSIDEVITRLQAIEKAAASDEAREDEDVEKDGDEERSRSYGHSPRKSRPMDLEFRTRESFASQSERILGSKEYRARFNDYLITGQVPGPEYRDVVMGTNSSGGYLVAPTQVSKDITMKINDLVFVRQLSTVETVNSAQSLGVRQLTTNPSDCLWTTEIGSISTDTTMAFGRRDLQPRQLTKMVAISLQMLEVSPDVVPLVSERIAYKNSIAEENAYMNGTGSGQPLGVFTASSNGIPTSQDVVCSASSSVQITADSLIAAKYAMKQPYLTGPNVRWVFSRPVMAQIRTLKDDYGRYLLVEGGGLASAPDTLLGIPVCVSEYAPSTFTAGAYVGLLGNFDYYRIAELATMQIQRLNELLALTSEVGFVSRRWFDASPVLGEAFVRLQLHS